MLLSEAEYAKLVKYMSTEAAIQATFKGRRSAEQRYFAHHRARGIRLRAKYGRF